MYLAHSFIDCFYKRICFVDNIQFVAWCQFNPLEHPEEVDGETLITDSDMRKFAKWFSGLFFGGQFDCKFE